MKFLAPSKMKFHPLLKLLVPLIEALPKCGTTLDDRDAYKVRYIFFFFLNDFFLYLPIDIVFHPSEIFQNGMKISSKSHA